MLDDLRRLLKLYEFYNSASTEQGMKAEPSAATSFVRQQRDRVLLDIATFASTDSRVIRVQIKFLLDCLSGLAKDSTTANALREACIRHLDNLAVSAEKIDRYARHSSPELKLRGKRRRARNPWRASDFACLDVISDRAALFDHNYRYVTMNRANAALHSVSKDAFSGRGHWDVMGNEFFEQVSKSRFDACLAGQTAAFYANKFARNGEIYWIRLSPVRDANEAVVGVMAIATDLSTLDVPSKMTA